MPLTRNQLSVGDHVRAHLFGSRLVCRIDSFRWFGMLWVTVYDVPGRWHLQLHPTIRLRDVIERVDVSYDPPRPMETLSAPQRRAVNMLRLWLRGN